jgi:hypothetical protein
MFLHEFIQLCPDVSDSMPPVSVGRLRHLLGRHFLRFECGRDLLPVTEILTHGRVRGQLLQVQAGHSSLAVAREAVLLERRRCIVGIGFVRALNGSRRTQG